MADNATLVVPILLVDRPRPRVCAPGGISPAHVGVALQAQRVDARDVQQPWVGRAVRSVTVGAAFNLDRLMLVKERSALVGVALEADKVLVGRGPQLAPDRRAVSVVAIAALDQPLIHAVPERLLEVGLLFRVAGEAQRRLRLDKLILTS